MFCMKAFVATAALFGSATGGSGSGPGWMNAPNDVRLTAGPVDAALTRQGSSIAEGSAGFSLYGGDCNTNGENDMDELTPVFDDYVVTPNLNFPDLIETTDTIIVNAAATGDMDDLNVDLVVTHIFMGDNQFWLNSPTGTTVDLMINVGGASDNADILFDDQASAFPPGGGPLVGTFKSDQPLAAFDLSQAARDGNWTFHCLDTFSGSGTGVLNQWSLHFRTFAAPDCNSNGVLDECDLFGGTSDDCNTNGVPDDCEAADCNTNGILDVCDIASMSDDCNTNLVPDECEIGDCGAPGIDWDNGAPDGVNGGANQLGGAAQAQIADDYQAGSADTKITGATFSDIEDTTYSWNGAVQAATYESTGPLSGPPQEAEFDLQLVSGGDVSRVQNGTLFGRPRWDYTLALDLASPGGGTHWVSLRPNSDGASGQAFWLTSHVPAVFGQSYFRSAFFGFPTWTASQIPLGANWDVAFTLTLSGCGDCNTNGQLDVCDIADGSSIGDCNGDGVPDECQDCNTNAKADECDILGGTSSDCNTNDIPDECDVASGSSVDCNGDGLPDECEGGVDCNTNGILDECDGCSGASADCNHNQVPDECDIAGGTALDVNTNGVPDGCDATACDIPPPFPDCNNNEVPDAIDIANGDSLDQDGNGVPDECSLSINMTGPWSNPGNWDPPIVPDNITGMRPFSVTIAGPAAFLQLDIPVEIDTLRMVGCANLDLVTGDLAIATPRGILNRGAITVGGERKILAKAAFPLKGTGTIRLAGENASLSSFEVGDRITNTVDHRIAGHGVIDADFFNGGVISADGGTLRIMGPMPKINDGLFEAVCGGTFIINTDIMDNPTGGSVKVIGSTMCIGNGPAGPEITMDGCGPIDVQPGSAALIKVDFANLVNASRWTIGDQQVGLGKTATMQLMNSSQGVVNGPVTVNQNGTLQIANSSLTAKKLMLANGSTLMVASEISLSDTLSFAGTDESLWSWALDAVLTLTDGAGTCASATWTRLEVGGLDSGPELGYSDNFDLSMLAIADAAAALLIDSQDNGNRNGPDGDAEALYADSLTIGEGAVLNLNGLHLYVAGEPITAGPRDGGEVIDVKLPSSVLPGDVDQDGMVDGCDIQRFVDVYFYHTGQDPGRPNNPGFMVPTLLEFCAVDIDHDGEITPTDLGLFISILLQ